VAAAALGWWAWLYAGLLTGPADALRALMADHRQTASLIAGSFVQEQERRLAAARAAGALPSIRAEIGAGSVDAFGGTQSLAVLNGLRYSPRPTLQEHMAYSDSLARANAAYLGAVAGPQYVLHRLRAIDGRFPPAEDPLSFLTLLNEFEPVGEERDVLLLRRKAARAAIETEPSAVRVSARWNEDIPVPGGANRIIQVAFVFREDLPARFARILWRAAEIQLVVTDETGLQRRYRLPPGNARTAFLISPVIGSDQDLKAWYRSGAGRSAASLRLEIMSRRPGFLLPNLESAEFRLIPVERAFGGSP
jgi:hypothetical protein